MIKSRRAYKALVPSDQKAQPGAAAPPTLGVGHLAKAKLLAC